MPYTVAQLSATLSSQIAPGNDAEFIRLLSEADSRLLEMGKWQWCREVLSLTPASGILTLPSTHIAILSARVDGVVKEVHSREAEFLLDSPEIEVQGPGSYRLYDLGSSTAVSYGPITVTGTLTSDGVTPVTFPEMLYVGQENGKPVWSDNGVDVYTSYFIRWIDDEWILRAFENDWISTEDTASPDLVSSWSPYPPGTGTPILNFTEDGLSVSTTRSYKIHGGLEFTDPVSALCSKAPAIIINEDSVPHCPSLTALKLAMMAIIYEEASDRDRSQAYWADALTSLTENAIQNQGGARQMRPSRKKRGFVSRPFYNFP